MKTEKDWKDFNKIERILMTYDRLYYGIAPELSNFPANSKKTFERDCNVLRKIGVEIKYSKTLKGYKSNARDCALSVPECENKAELRFLQRLVRLLDAMFSLDEDVSGWYKDYYPAVTPRTRQRDLETLRNIGYEVRYIGGFGGEEKWVINFPVGY
jgi:predicted DNA-binding transcriptional regulator YafY